MSEFKILYKSEDKKTIDDYIILETIGKGAFGKVKLGIHKPTNQEVAIKIYEKKNFIFPNDIINFKKEISILKKVNHPNIIKIYNVLEDEYNYYIIMEYASKGDLFSYIVNKKKLDEKEAAYFYCQLIHGLEFLHNNNITHRDLKPENLLIKDHNMLTIIDFGLSNEYNKNQLLTTPCGSPSYAAPEMILGRKYNGLSIDIWSSGITLYAMVCGHLPFKDKDQEKLYKKIITCNYSLPSFLSDECKDLIKRILCNNEKNRININDIKKHSFLAESFKKYNPNEFIYYNHNKIYNKIIEIMINNLSEYNYKKDDIIHSIKNNEFNNITTTYKLLLKKIYFRENENKQNFLFTKSSTDSCVTTNNVSNLIVKSVYPTLDDRKKTNNKIIEKRQNNNRNNNNNSNININDSNKEIKKINTNKFKNSLYLPIKAKNDNNQKNNNLNNKIYSYYIQANEQKKIKGKNKGNNQIITKAKTNYKNNKCNNNQNQDNNDEKDINPKIKGNFNDNLETDVYINDKTKKNNLEYDIYSTLNSNSSREITKYKKEMNNKSNDKTKRITIYNTHQKNLKILSNEFADIFNHNQNIYSNDICNYNISEISELGIEKKSSHKNNNDSPSILLTQSKKKIKKKKKNNIDYILKNCHLNKVELNKSNISHKNSKLSSNLNKNKNLKKHKQKKYNDNNLGEKTDSNYNSSILNYIQTTKPQSKNTTKQKFLKLNNFKEKKFTSRHSPSPPSVFIKINTEKHKNKKQVQNTEKKNQSKSINKKLFFNNSSNNKINTENIFSKNNNIINSIQRNNKNENKNKSNPKTYYSIYKQKSLNESSNIIKISKKPKNCNRKNSNSLAFNPFNKSLNNNHNNNHEKNSINYSNSINNNNNNSSKNTINNISLMNSVKTINEKKLVKLKTLSNKSLNSYYYNNEQKKKDQSLSNKNIIKFKSEEINYYNNTFKKNIYNINNNINDACNDSICSDNHFIRRKYKKSNDKYSKKTYDLNSNDFAVCNTNSSLEDINKKLKDLSQNKGFSLLQIDLVNYICTKNKNSSIKIEISSKGNINMLKIYYLEGKESITKELIKNIIFSIGF